MLQFLCGTALIVKGVHIICQNSQLDALKICIRVAVVRFILCVNAWTANVRVANASRLVHHILLSVIDAHLHSIKTIISWIVCYREIASRTKFDCMLLPPGEEKSAKFLTVVNRYTVGQDQNFDIDKKFAAAKLQTFVIGKISFSLRVPSFRKL
jgi:hypothetical protein